MKLFFYLSIAGVEAFHDFIGNVESRVDIERSPLEEDRIVVMLGVISVDERMYGILYDLVGGGSTASAGVLSGRR